MRRFIDRAGRNTITEALIPVPRFVGQWDEKSELFVESYVELVAEQIIGCTCGVERLSERKSGTYALQSDMILFADHDTDSGILLFEVAVRKFCIGEFRTYVVAFNKSLCLFVRERAEISVAPAGFVLDCRAYLRDYIACAIICES